MTHSTGEHLTTSRISRLFRPLRAKCKNLASLPVPSVGQTSNSSVVTTYASSSRLSAPASVHASERPPLLVIPPPEKLASLVQLDRFSRSNLQLSKKLYDVRDAFRNLVQVALGSALSSGSRRGRGGGTRIDAEEEQGRVRSLAAMCSMTIGELVEAQVQIGLEEKGDEEELREDEEMEIIHELYEAIPPQYRRHAVISHALDIILAICPSNHTLLEILLDVTLANNLREESTLILRQLLQLVFVPLNPKSGLRESLPVAHPAHSRYLSNLLDMCCGASNGALLNEREFTQFLCETLVETPPASWKEAWTCKATVVLARALQSRDYQSFLSLSSCLQHSISKANATPLSGHCGESADTGEARLKARLAKWLTHACRRMYNRSSVLDNCGAEEARAVAGIVVDAEAMGLYDPLCIEPDSLSSVLVCLATVCLDTSFAALLSPDVRAPLLAALRRMNVNAKSHAFDTLVLLAMPQEGQSEGSGSSLVANIRSTTIPAVRNWARTLRDCSCHLLEASLWASAVHHIESLSPETGPHYDPACHSTVFTQELLQLTAELVNMGEDAERSFDGRTRHVITQTPRRRTLQNGEWRWDDTFDCFVQKTPVCGVSPPRKAAKRRYTETNATLPLKRTRVRPMVSAGVPAAPALRSKTTTRSSLSFSRASSASSSASACSAPRALSRKLTPPYSPSPSCVPVSTSSSSISSASSRVTTPTEEQENIFSGQTRDTKAYSTQKPSRRQPRPSNFTSILRDAQMNTIVLHSRHAETAAPRRKMARSPDPARSSPASSVSVSVSAASDHSDEDVDVSMEGAAFGADDPSSDDVLDLFQYGSDHV